MSVPPTIWKMFRVSFGPSGRQSHIGESKRHKIHIELRPKDKFSGYGIPYYKRGYSRIE